jgi:hypothetical protein
MVAETNENAEEPDFLFTENRRLEWGLQILFSIQVALYGWWFLFYQFGEGRYLYALAVVLLLSSISQMVAFSSRTYWNSRIREFTDHPRFSNVSAGLGLFYSVSGFLASFAMLYWQAANDSPKCFSEPLSKLDATYFAFTTFTTTGFGDIYATSPGCRGLVILQMLLGVLILSIVVGLAVGRVAGRR